MSTLLDRPGAVDGSGIDAGVAAHYGNPHREQRLLQEGLAMRRNQDLSWSQVALAANAPMLIKAALVDGKPEVGILPTGQVAGVIDELPTVAELIARIEAEAAATLKALT